MTSLAPARRVLGSVNFVKSSRRKSAARDARFPQEAVAPAPGASQAVSAGTSVYSPLPLSLSTPTININTTPSTTTVTSTTTNTTTPSKPTPSAYAHPTASPIAYRVPAAWRDLSDQARAAAFLRGLRSLGPTFDFTLNLSPKVEAQAASQASSLEWLRRRIARRLEAALGRPVSLVIAIEQTAAGRLHLHGVLGISLDEAKAARKALRRAGGEWKTTRQHQAQTRPDPDDGWAAYIAKDFKLAGRIVRRRTQGDPKRARRFQGPVLSASQDVRQAAKIIYDAWRAAALGKKSSSVSNSNTRRTYSKSLLTYRVFIPISFALTPSANRLIQLAYAKGEFACPINTLQTTFTTRWWQLSNGPRPFYVPAPARSAPMGSCWCSARSAAFGRQTYSRTSPASMPTISGWPTRSSWRRVSQGRPWAAVSAPQRLSRPRGVTGADDSLKGSKESSRISLHRLRVAST